MARTIAVMQPYLFPYLGYFQLIAAADVFVLGDDLQYVRSGWVNRNRILQNGEARLITFPLKKDRFVLQINQRQLCDHFSDEAERLIRLMTECYQEAPYFAQVMPLVERLIRFPQQNIALYAEHAIREMCAYLHIVTPIMRSSDLILGSPVDKQERIIRIAHTFEATTFITPEGGSVVYDRDHFARNRLLVRFFRMSPVEYRQFRQPFVANLSIIDVLMFNCVEQVQHMLTQFQLDKNPPAAEPGLLARLKQHPELVPTLSKRIAVE
nr:WbqC family protein [uncultured Pseudomonas sp.]